MKRKFAAGLTIISSVVLATASVHADSLFLSPGYLQQKPDISGAHLIISYDGSSLLHITGDATLLTLSPAPADVFDIGNSWDSGDNQMGYGTFDLTANVDPTGHLFNGGTLTIKGDIDDGNGFQTLFSSTHLLQFGSGASEQFQFLFQQDGGSVTSATGKIGVKAFGMGGIANVPDFGTIFSNANSTNKGQADAAQVTAVVPAPTASAAGLGLLAVVGIKRATRRHRQA